MLGRIESFPLATFVIRNLSLLCGRLGVVSALNCSVRIARRSPAHPDSESAVFARNILALGFDGLQQRCSVHPPAWKARPTVATVFSVCMTANFNPYPPQDKQPENSNSGLLRTHAAIVVLAL